MIKTEHRFFFGLDVGQANDPTALAVVDQVRTIRADEIDRTTFETPESTVLHLRHLERVKLGTPYPQVVELVEQRVCAPQLGEWPRDLVVDATGVGRPLVDMLRAAPGLVLAAVPIQAVTITGGDAPSGSGREARVPKRDLVTNLALLYQQSGLLMAANLAEGAVFVRELLNFKVKISAAGHDSYAAWRDGQHDDLVLAVALACWRARAKRSVGQGKRAILSV